MMPDMNSQDNLLAELETALTHKDLSRRADVLRRVTDLFVLGSGAFSSDQIDLFDKIMIRLIENIETAIRAEFSNRLAGQADGPRRTVHALAFDEAIDVARPVLERSECLEEAALIENARTMGQGHLLAIAGRRTLGEALTDVLIERGDGAVVGRTAGNHGARFSSGGLSVMASRSRDDSKLARVLWARTDIPRQVLLRIFTEASEATRKALEAENPRQAAAIRHAVAAATNEIQSKARNSSAARGREHAAVAALHAAGELDEARLFTFASKGAFDSTASALSFLCDLPIGLVERCLVEQRTEQILVLARATELSWRTAAALILLQAGDEGMSRSQLDQCFATFSRLQKKTAQTALQFYRMREGAGGLGKS